MHLSGKHPVGDRVTGYETAAQSVRSVSGSMQSTLGVSNCFAPVQRPSCAWRQGRTTSPCSPSTSCAAALFSSVAPTRSLQARSQGRRCDPLCESTSFNGQTATCATQPASSSLSSVQVFMRVCGSWRACRRKVVDEAESTEYALGEVRAGVHRLHGAQCLA